MTTFTLPDLPYGKESLSPVLSKETLDYHHDKHHMAYVTNLNNLIKGTEFENADLETIIRQGKGGLFNNAAQVWNHTFYFEQFGIQSPVSGRLADAIRAKWGSFEAFQKEFNAAGAGLFGSGWVWLSCDNKGELSISQEPNAGNPLTHDLHPLLTFDVWEHAYYIDYRNARPAYIEALWKIVDWRVMERRYEYQSKKW